MVSVSAPRSATGIADAFSRMGITELAKTGTLAIVGGSVAVVATEFVKGFLGLNDGRQTRADALALGVTSILVGMAAVKYGGTQWGGAMAIGPLLMVGVAVMGMLSPGSILPPEISPEIGGTFRQSIQDGHIRPEEYRNGQKSVSASVPEGEPRDIAIETPVQGAGFR